MAAVISRRPPGKATSPTPERAKPPGRSLDAGGRVDADERAADSVRLRQRG